MTTLVKIHRKGQLTLPSSFRAAMGITEGSIVELSLKNGKTVITPTIVPNGSELSNTDAEYTPAQHRVINAQLAEAAKGPFHGPFETPEEMIDFLHAEVKKPKSKQTGKRHPR